MDDATAAKPDLTRAVYSISLADLCFNLEKKNTSKSKRAVGTDELRRVIASLGLQAAPSDIKYTQISTTLDSTPSQLPHYPRSLETDNEPRRREVSAEAQPVYSEQLGRRISQVPETITTEESAWTEGYYVNETSGLFEEEVVKGTEQMRVIEAKGPRIATPELDNTEVARSISPLRMAKLEEDISISTPRQPVIEAKVLRPSSAERPPEPEHHPNVPFRLNSTREEGEVEPCPTAFPPKPKKPKRPKAIPTLETIQQAQISPVPRPAKRPKPEKVDIGLQPVTIAPTLDIGGRVDLEIRHVEASLQPELQPYSPATEPKETEDGVTSKRVTIAEIKARVSLQPLQNTTLSSFAPSQTTKTTGSPRSEDAETISKSQSPIIPSKRPGTATFSLPPGSPFDLPTRLHPSRPLRTSLETLESLSIPANCKSMDSSLMHQTSLERLEYVAVPAKEKAELRLQRMRGEEVQPRLLETSEVGVDALLKTSTDQVTATEINTGLSSWTMSVYPPAKPVRSLVLQPTLADSIHPIHPPTPVRNRRRRKQGLNLIYKQGTGENGALFQLSPTVGRMVKVKEYMVIHAENREKVTFPPLYSPDVVNAMAMQRKGSHQGLSREKAALSPVRAGESYRNKEFFMRFRGMGSVGSRVNSRDTSESPEKAFRKTPKLNFKLL